MLGRRSLLLALAAAAALPQCAGFAAFVPSPHALGTRAAALPRVAPPAALRGGSGVSGLRAQSMYQKIEEKLTAGLKPVKLTIVDNSHQHAGHAGVNGRDGETHFAVDVVSEEFAGLRPVKRHQLVYSLLAKEMEGGMDYNGIHALEIKARTPEEDAKS